jgi:hypothetical protein
MSGDPRVRQDVSAGQDAYTAGPTSTSFSSQAPCNQIRMPRGKCEGRARPKTVRPAERTSSGKTCRAVDGLWLLERYSPAYASNQFRALQQFFKWLAAEEEVPDPMAGLRPPHVHEKPVPVFTGEEELLRLERACTGRSFQADPSGGQRSLGLKGIHRLDGSLGSTYRGPAYFRKVSMSRLSPAPR